jgi:hypothetical protein
MPAVSQWKGLSQSEFDEIVVGLAAIGELARADAGRLHPDDPNAAAALVDDRLQEAFESLREVLVAKRSAPEEVAIWAKSSGSARRRTMEIIWQ